jgi:prevent-host-death family protein
MKTINIHAAKTHLSSLLAEVEAGEEIIIAKAGKPVARLMPLQKNDFRRSFGALKGRIHMKDDFDAPLPPEIAKGFGIGS